MDNSKPKDNLVDHNLNDSQISDRDTLDEPVSRTLVKTFNNSAKRLKKNFL